MKKRLESELISIAHRILKLKNKSEVDQLYRETQKLYETLTVLKFYGDNYEQLKLDVTREELEDKIENSLATKQVQADIISKIPTEFATENVDSKKEITEKAAIEEKVEDEKVKEVALEEKAEEAIEEKAALKEEVEEEKVKEVALEQKVEETNEDTKNNLDFEPIFELAAEVPEEEFESENNIIQVQTDKEIIFEPKKQEPKQISFEDLLGQNYTEPIFDKPSNVPTSIPKIVDETTEEIVNKQTNLNQVKIEEIKPATFNDNFSTAINVGLNDRVAFVKNLFDDSNEDYNRVISQLNTFDTLQEAQEFIEDMVKPDYNDWTGKEEYQERFMEVVEKKFA